MRPLLSHFLILKIFFIIWIHSLLSLALSGYDWNKEKRTILLFLSRIPALNPTSIPTLHSPVTPVYRYLKKFRPQSTPLTTRSPSSPGFLFLHPLLCPVSTDPSLCPSSCVSRTPTGGKCQPANPEWQEKLIKFPTNQLYPCPGNSSDSLCSIHSNTHLN